MAKSRGAVDPRAYQQIVGSTFANHDHRPLITIGPRSWDRWQLGRLGCPHPVAALRVNRVIKTLQINSPAEFIKLAPVFGTYKEIGVTSYWVVLALLHDLGENIEDAHGDNPTFHTMHRKAMLKDAKRSSRKKKRTTA
jgi:hypothetical protein